MDKIKISPKTYNIIRNIMLIIIAILFVAIMRTLFKPTLISGTSMEPTYHQDQYVIGHWFLNVDRFDVMVIDVGDKELIKRVVGLPNETIEFKDNVLYVNGNIVEDTYANGSTEDFAITLGPDEYFCMGDNREHSIDSRYYGTFTYKSFNAKMNWS